MIKAWPRGCRLYYGVSFTQSSRRRDVDITEGNLIPPGITSCCRIIRDLESSYRIMWPRSRARYTRYLEETKSVLQLWTPIPEIIWVQVSQGCYGTDWISSEHRIIYTSRNIEKKNIQFTRLSDFSYATCLDLYFCFVWISGFKNIATFAIKIVREIMKTGLKFETFVLISW